MATHNQYQKIVPFIIFVLALFLFFKLIQPMITILLGGILLAYISFPLHKRIIKKFPNKSISIALSLLIVLILLMIPFLFLTFEITRQGYSLFNSLSTNVQEGALFGIGCSSVESRICLLVNQAETFSLERLSIFSFDKQLKKLLILFGEKITKFILTIPIILAKIFLTFIISYYILKDWENILKKIIYVLPMRTNTTNKLIKEFENTAYTVVYAQLFVALVQGLVGTIGFYVFGIPFPIFLGVILAFCALIPAIGTAIVWGPASLFLILSGYFSNDYWVLGRGIGLFLYGLLIISTIDNILLAKIVHAKTKVSQIIVITGVIGGASLFGVMGIFIGPILLPLLITYFETFKQRFV